jgi:hypothetical protein
MPSDAIIIIVEGGRIDPLAESYVHLISGTGSFSTISAGSKVINVVPGAIITGSITMNVKNDMSGSAVAPLIGTTSWGTHSTSFWTVNNWIGTGTGTYTSSDISLTAPSAPGTYYLIFAFNGEMESGQVASTTNWRIGSMQWEDGNDVADYNATQIAEAQANGRTLVNYQFLEGAARFTMPSDVLVINIGQVSTFASLSGKIVDANGNGMVGITVALENGTFVKTDAQGLFTIMAAPGDHTLTISGPGIDTKKVTATLTSSGLAIGNIATSQAGQDMTTIIMVVVIALIVIVAIVLLARRGRS